LYEAAAASWQPGTFRQQLYSLHWPSRGSMFRTLHDANATISQQLMSFASPLQLTRREMLTNIGSLTKARDAAAVRVGILASQGPMWRTLGYTSAVAPEELTDEASRVYSVLCDVLDVNGDGHSLLTATAVEAQVGKTKGNATPATLLDILEKQIPRVETILDTTLKQYGRPSRFTRLWFGYLFLPPALFFAATAIARNKDWMKEQLANAKETIKGFVVQWVWEPIEDIAETMRGGGKGLDVSPETVKADRESLERMVLDLGRDYYRITDSSSLEALKKQVESGDLSAVLKVYEQEMQSPIKNALAGNLIRTLLIQVQKTKVGFAPQDSADRRRTCPSRSSLSTSSCAASS
jgi:nuclear-control-of-ATPase protein 2